MAVIENESVFEDDKRIEALTEVGTYLCLHEYNLIFFSSQKVMI